MLIGVIIAKAIKRYIILAKNVELLKTIWKKSKINIMYTTQQPICINIKANL